MFRSVRKSILLKLLVVLVLAGTVVNVLVSGFFHRTVHRPSDTSGRRVLIAHLLQLVQDIGIPPDRAKADEIAKRLSLGIRYEGPGTRWSAGDAVPPEGERGLAPTSDPKVRTARQEGTLFVEVARPPGRYLFAVDLRPDHDLPEERVAALVVLLTLVFAGAYFAIRRILKPLQWLTEGVEAVSAGDLEHQVRSRGDDDLGALAASFNVMTRRIRDMIQAHGELLLNVSHELRSPLTRIKVALEFLPEAPAKESIREDLAGMETMLGEILETERLRSPHGGLHLQPVDLAALVRDVVSRLEDRGPGVALRVPDEPLWLRLDPDRMRTAVRNVLENATKYSDAGSPPVDVSLDQDKQEVVLRVRNRGAPIAPEELALLFEPFYRVDKSRSRSTGGYGLGLSLCRTILEKHGGSAVLESSAQDGTVVELRLPGTLRVAPTSET